VFFQLVSLVGASLILLPFALLNTGRMQPTNVWYSIMNFVGSSLLGWVAVVDQRIGFIILEVAWAVVSLLPLLRSRTAGNKTASA